MCVQPGPCWWCPARAMVARVECCFAWPSTGRDGRTRGLQTEDVGECPWASGHCSDGWLGPSSPWCTRHLHSGEEKAGEGLLNAPHPPLPGLGRGPRATRARCSAPEWTRWQGRRCLRGAGAALSPGAPGRQGTGQPVSLARWRDKRRSQARKTRPDALLADVYLVESLAGGPPSTPGSSFLVNSLRSQLSTEAILTGILRCEFMGRRSLGPGTAGRLLSQEKAVSQKAGEQLPPELPPRGLSAP